MAVERYPAEAIIEDYTSGVSMAQIRERYGITHDSTIYGILKRYDVPADRRGVNRDNRQKYNHEQVVSDYLSGMSLSEITVKHGFPHYQVVYPILEKQGISRERISGNKPLSMKPWNSGFFARQTKESAYWAGFLMADGSLRNEKGSTWVLKLDVHEKDLRHLWAYCDALDLDRKYAKSQLNRYRTKEYLMYSATVYHPSLPTMMRPWGIVQRKTYEYVAPEVDDEVLPDYLRGWFDGDGCLLWGKRGKKWGITGNWLALQWYEEALRSLGFTQHISMSHTEGKVWGRLNIFGAENIQIVAELLKAHTSFRLARKWDKLITED